MKLQNEFSHFTKWVHSRFLVVSLTTFAFVATGVGIVYPGIFGTTHSDMQVASPPKATPVSLLSKPRIIDSVNQALIEVAELLCLFSMIHFSEGFLGTNLTAGFSNPNNLKAPRSRGQGLV